MKGECSCSDCYKLFSPGVWGHFTHCSINKAIFTLFLQSLNVKYIFLLILCWNKLLASLEAAQLLDKHKENGLTNFGPNLDSLEAKK